MIYAKSLIGVGPSQARHSGPDPLETIFVKIEKSLQNLQIASKSYNTPEFCAQLKHNLHK